MPLYYGPGLSGPGPVAMNGRGLLVTVTENRRPDKRRYRTVIYQTDYLKAHNNRTVKRFMPSLGMGLIVPQKL